MHDGGNMGIDLSISLKQKLQISQQQLQSLEILAMDNLELSKLMTREFLENPLFERREGSFVIEKSESYLEKPGEEVSPEEIIMSQINRSNYSDSEIGVMKYLIAGLDEDGYYSTPLEDVVINLKVKIQVVEKCLLQLKKVEPAGIFAKDLKECLLLQLERKNLKDKNLTMIIESYLEEVGDGKVSTISRECELSTAQVRLYMAQIEQLNPRPLAGISEFVPVYIVPDLIVEFEENEFSIYMNDEWVENYGLSDYYLRMMHETKDQELLNYFQEHYDRAKLILKNVQSRRETIVSIATHIVENQKNYFLNKGKLETMKMSEVANKLNIHVSTVSRAVKGKYLQYPGGTVALRDLFCTHSVIQSIDGEINSIYIKEKLSTMIKSEHSEKPLSDANLVKIFQQDGITLSRRVIAKYREEMGIKSSFQRKNR